MHWTRRSATAQVVYLLAELLRQKRSRFHDPRKKSSDLAHTLCQPYHDPHPRGVCWVKAAFSELQLGGASPPANLMVGKRYASNVGPCNVVLLPSRNALPWIVRSARNMIGFKQIEFFDHTRHRITSTCWYRRRRNPTLAATSASVAYEWYLR